MTDLNIVVRPLVRTELYRIAQHLVNGMWQKKRLLSLYNVKLSTILHPNNGPHEGGEIVNFKDPRILNNSVGLAICEVKETAGVQKLPLVIIDTADQASDEKRDVLREVIPYVVVDDPDDLVAAVKAVQSESVRATTSSPRRNTQLMPSEWAAYIRMNIALDRSHLTYLAEVGLDELFSLDVLAREKIRLRAAKLNSNGQGRIGRWPDRTLNFDGVVATALPYGVPVAVFELDGTSHDKPSKRKKDALKAWLCQEAGVPLIRVGVENCDDVDRLALEFITRLAPVLARHLKTSERYIATLLAAAESELKSLKPRSRSNDLRQLITHARSWYEDRLDSLRTDVRNQDVTIKSQYQAIGQLLDDNPLLEAQSAQLESMQEAIHRDALADALGRRPEMLYEVEAVFDRTQVDGRSTIIRVRLVPKADAVYMNLPIIAIPLIALRVEVIGTSDVSDLTLREAKKFFDERITADGKRRVIDREKGISL